MSTQDRESTPGADTISVSAAKQLLNLHARPGIIDAAAARDQLRTAVALHNMLVSRERVAYLADEVGMGKTYVSLATIALLRHWKPQAKVLIIAPSKPVQSKWASDYRDFFSNGGGQAPFVRFADLANRSADGDAARRPVTCERLVDFAHEVNLDPNRDFLLRLSSFSLGHIVGTAEALRREIPWLPDGFIDGRNRTQAKRKFAWGLNVLLPEFDLVIIDEGHNLKHGIDHIGAERKSARNNVLARMLGSIPNEYELLAGHTGQRSRAVLLLSATPVETGFSQLYRQLETVGRHEFFPQFDDDGTSDELRAAAASRLLIRRVRTTTTRAGETLSRNQYRDEWRAGGVERYDVPMATGGVRERLTVALVQKRVSDVLESKPAGASFQIGMLASFESFQRTAEVTARRADSDDEEAPSAFDDARQTEDSAARRGMDVGVVNALAKSHRRRFSAEMAHPKMDGIVRAISRDWDSGEKHLIFVRRVASVVEIRRKLEESHDAWLIPLVRAKLAPGLREEWDLIVSEYRSVRGRFVGTATERDDPLQASLTLLKWFFLGTESKSKPDAWFSGEDLRNRLRQPASWWGLASRDNVVVRLMPEMARRVGGPKGLKGIDAFTYLIESDSVGAIQDVTERAQTLLTRTGVGYRFDALQIAALQLVSERGDASLREFCHRLAQLQGAPSPGEGSVPVLANAKELLKTQTLVSALAAPERLGHAVIPLPSEWSHSSAEEDHLRANVLAASLRNGIALVDLFIATSRDLRTLRKAPNAPTADGGETLERGSPPWNRAVHHFGELVLDDTWGTKREITLLAEHHQRLARDVRRYEIESGPLRNGLGDLLGAQSPVVGMFGQVNETAARQFRWPCMPQVLISTDLLQEGVDLHTFCARVHHYGLPWNPSSLEQRTGRIDRIGSLTERRLSTTDQPALEPGPHHLQVTIPYLQDSIEVLQAKRLMTASDRFLALMHAGLVPETARSTEVKLADAVLGDLTIPAQPRELLVSAFRVKDEHLRGAITKLAVDHTAADQLQAAWNFAVDEAGGELGGASTAYIGNITAHLTHADRHGVIHAQMPLSVTTNQALLHDPDARLKLLCLAGERGLYVAYDARSAEGDQMKLTGSVLLDPNAPHEAAARRVSWLLKLLLETGLDLGAPRTATGSTSLSKLQPSTRKWGKDWGIDANGLPFWLSRSGRTHRVWKEIGVGSNRPIALRWDLAVARVGTEYQTKRTSDDLLFHQNDVLKPKPGSVAVPAWRQGKGMMMTAAMPTSGYSFLETRFVLLQVAQQADRAEYLLTGRDRH